MGYPFVLVFAVVCRQHFCYTFKNDWPNSGYGVLVILSGIPLFAYFARKRNSRGIPDNRWDLKLLATPVLIPVSAQFPPYGKPFHPASARSVPVSDPYSKSGT